MNFKNKVVLAPMVNVNNIAFRKLCSEHGADIVYSQMIDAVAFDRSNKKLADFYDEKNLIAQFFGNDAEVIVRCAKAVEDHVKAVDFNLGCPHSTSVERRCGSYLMEYPKKVGLIVEKLVKAVKVPITVKIRAGYDRNNINAVSIAKLCEKKGVSAIAVHGRARTVNYEYPVDYSIINKVKRAVKIPVIGNGDIFNGESAKRMFATGCDSIMVARGAIGNPCIFNEIKDHLKGRKGKECSKKQIFLLYLKYCKKYNVEFKNIKTHVQWLTKGVKRGGRYRLLMNNAKNIGELREIYSDI